MTRLQIETYLVGGDLVSGQRGKVCSVVPLYVVGSVTLGAIPALSGPITGALRFLGVEPVDPTNPVDADFATLQPSSNAALMDMSDLFLLEACLGNWAEWDQQISQGKQSMSQLGDRLLAELNRLTTLYKSQYGYGLGTPSLSQTDLGFSTPAPWFCP